MLFSRLTRGYVLFLQEWPRARPWWPWALFHWWPRARTWWPAGADVVRCVAGLRPPPTSRACAAQSTPIPSQDGCAPRTGARSAAASSLAPRRSPSYRQPPLAPSHPRPAPGCVRRGCRRAGEAGPVVPRAPSNQPPRRASAVATSAVPGEAKATAGPLAAASDPRSPPSPSRSAGWAAASPRGLVERAVAPLLPPAARDLTAE